MITGRLLREGGEGGGRREGREERGGCRLEAGGLRVKNQQSSNPRIKIGEANAAKHQQ
jgi:hypothetical protein